MNVASYEQKKRKMGKQPEVVASSNDKRPLLDWYEIIVAGPKPTLAADTVINRHTALTSIAVNAQVASTKNKNNNVRSQTLTAVLQRVSYQNHQPTCHKGHNDNAEPQRCSLSQRQGHSVVAVKSQCE